MSKTIRKICWIAYLKDEFRVDINEDRLRSIKMFIDGVGRRGLLRRDGQYHVLTTP
jgi:hypothetical protein